MPVRLFCTTNGACKDVQPMLSICVSVLLLYARKTDSWQTPWVAQKYGTAKVLGSGYFYGTVNDTRLSILTAIARCHGYSRFQLLLKFSTFRDIFA